MPNKCLEIGNLVSISGELLVITKHEEAFQNQHDGSYSWLFTQLLVMPA
jgi:hypothetical protein